MGKPTGAFAPRDDGHITVTHLGREDVLGIGSWSTRSRSQAVQNLLEDRLPSAVARTRTVVPREDLQKAQVPAEGTVDWYSSGGLHCLGYCCHAPTFLSCGTSARERIVGNYTTYRG